MLLAAERSSARSQVQRTKERVCTGWGCLSAGAGQQFHLPQTLPVPSCPVELYIPHQSCPVFAPLASRRGALAQGVQKSARRRAAGVGTLRQDLVSA